MSSIRFKTQFCLHRGKSAPIISWYLEPFFCNFCKNKQSLNMIEVIQGLSLAHSRMVDNKICSLHGLRGSLHGLQDGLQRRAGCNL